jgi:hypothetical protein
MKDKNKLCYAGKRITALFPVLLFEVVKHY